MVIPELGDAGALGTYNNVKYDTWVLTPRMIKTMQQPNSSDLGGHAMIIHGFDDFACASYTDDYHENKQQCGLLYLRNSWSEETGDKGDYYMTYDYFKTMAIESNEIGFNIS